MLAPCSVRALGRKRRRSVKPFGPGTAHFLTAPRLFGKIGRDNPAGLVPDLVYPEFANTIWKHVKRLALDPSDGEAMIAAFLALPFDVVSSQAILVPAFRIAHSLGKPVYDALFLALSQEADADMVTADELLYEAARGHFPRLRRLAAWGAE